MAESFATTVGATLMGVLFNSLLTSVVLLQFYTYWNSTYKDPLWIKLIVLFLFTINVVHQGSAMYMAWFYCVENFDNPAAVQREYSFTSSCGPQHVNSPSADSLWVYAFTAIVTAVLAIMNQVFQSWRIWVLIKNKYVVGGLLLTAFVDLIAGTTAGILSWIISDLPRLAKLQPLVMGNLALQAALDVTITGILIYGFTKSKTSFRRTDMVLNRLIRRAIESGMFTSLFALGELFAFRFAVGTYIIGVFALPIGRIYTHTMMDHLIRRDELRGLLSNRSAHKDNIISIPAFDVPGRGGADTTDIAISYREEREAQT
ncbi:hypothetical protein C8J57DRAFT_1668587 [Mycena rebaudengoi]|nr:hypothetical protein C8J57DRAFT_1668587 [Mycena rebaudengoi]